jgi:hypothetical protein
MDELEVLRDVADRLGRSAVSYMLTGSLAMGYYAEPRMTRDIDIVAELRDVDAASVIRRFQDGYYLSPDAVREAIRTQTMFNAIHSESLVKVDFIVRKSTPFRETEFARRQRRRIGDFDVFLVTKEDLIISKIGWALDSRSEVQLRDVKSLLSTGYDQEYVEHWLRELDLHDFSKAWLA